ncbi:VCBS repeat-containing protein [Candidatus Woesearchaeota archaeon]|nr:VCBS repeat-containing protein [Candidatus Woesearchaeota archaeon]
MNLFEKITKGLVVFAFALPIGFAFYDAITYVPPKPKPRIERVVHLELPNPRYKTGFGVAAADFDGDGDVDIVYARHPTKEELKGKPMKATLDVMLYEREGKGFKPPRKIAELPGGIYEHGAGLAAADFDGDGDMDLAYARVKTKEDGFDPKKPTMSLELFLNDGKGNFR